MLSTESQILIKLQGRWASFVGGIPCKLDSHCLRFLWTEYHWKKFLVHSIFHWIYSLYLGARFISIHKWRHENKYDYYFCFAAFLLHLILSLLGIFVILECWKNKVASLNAGYDFWMYMKKMYMKETGLFYTHAEAICGIVTLSCFGFAPLLMGYLKLHFPKSPYFIYTVLPESFQRVWITVPVEMLLLWMLWSGLSLVGVVTHLALMNTCSAIKVVSNELQPNRSRYLTAGHLRTPKNLRHAYRSLQLVLQCYQELFGHLVLPLQLVLNRGFVLCTFILIRYYSRISIGTKVILSLSTVLCSLWCVILYVGGKMSVCSKGCLVSWKKFRWSCKHPSELKDAQSMSKFRKSCTRLQFKMGVFYYIGRSSCIKYIRDVSRGTGKALLAITK